MAKKANMEAHWGTSQASGAVMIESAERAVVRAERPHHRAPMATLVARVIVTVSLLMGAFSFLLGPNWRMLWGALVLLVLAGPASAVLRRLGYGQS